MIRSIWCAQSLWIFTSIISLIFFNLHPVAAAKPTFGWNSTSATLAISTQAYHREAPSIRSKGVTWTDKQGALYLFGGYDVGHQLDDFWKYENGTTSTTPQWQRIPKSGVWPPSLYNAVSWTDRDGDLWLFGGNFSSALGYGDLWRYNAGTTTGTAEWRHYDSPSASPVLRSRHFGWTDIHGDFWLFGGTNSTLPGPMNDLWKFSFDQNSDTVTWTPVAETGVWPTGRNNAATWVDDQGDFWMYGGSGGFDIPQGSPRTDLWRYNAGTAIGAPEWMSVPIVGLLIGPSRTQATWTNPDTGDLWAFGGADYNLYDYGVYSKDLWQLQVNETGTSATWLKAPLPAISPTDRAEAMSWTGADGSFWILGGYDSHYKNDFWKAENISSSMPAQWTRLDNWPSHRANAATWQDNQGNLWLFGGRNPSASSTFNDLWKLDGNSDQPRWTPISKTNAEYWPPVRAGASAWKDQIGNLWMFGGENHSRRLYYNDLWVYTLGSEPGNPRWKKLYNSGVRPELPSPRTRSACWSTSDGAVWLYGGYAGNPLYDLWKIETIGTQEWKWTLVDPEDTIPPHLYHNPAQWLDDEDNLWMFGYPSENLWKFSTRLSPTTNWSFITTSVPAPPTRAFASGWTDFSGRFWLFAGRYMSFVHNDLWMFDPAAAIWNSIAPPDNWPTSRYDASEWTSPGGDLMMFGGMTSESECLNDLWQIRLSDQPFPLHTSVNQPVSFEVPVNDPDGTAVLSVLIAPDHGTATIGSNTTNTLIYQPAPDRSGTDKLTLSLKGPDTEATTATLFIPVMIEPSNIPNALEY